MEALALKFKINYLKYLYRNLKNFIGKFHKN
jgi:hypothetical protein